MPLFSRRGRVAQPEPAPVPEPTAVQQAVRAVYPDAEPRTLAVRAMPDRPFAGAVHAYPLGDHGLLVTDGLAAHGWSELTLRVGAEDLVGTPPAVPWPFQVLVFLANSAVSSDRGFGPAARLENSAPFNGDENATARCLVFTPDPKLEGFLQAVPVTPDDLEVAAEKGTAEVVDRLSEGNPLLIARLYG